VAMSIVRTTLPKGDNMGTSSVEPPMAWTLVAQPGSKALDDNLAGNDPDFLNFEMAESEAVCRMSSQLLRC
jgi:hypothetical protein